MKVLMGMLASGVGEKIGGVIGGDVIGCGCVGLGDGGGKNINSDGSGCGVGVSGHVDVWFWRLFKVFLHCRCQCRCEPGFRLKNDGKTCMDVDECTTTYPCSQRCVNSHGSFHCFCVEGYVAHANDSTRCKSASGKN